MGRFGTAMYFAYTLALAFGLLLALPYTVLHSRGFLPGLKERLGFVKPLRGRRPIWIHAVSVGEARAVEGLLDGLRQPFHPHPIVVSTTTATGRQLVLDRGEAEGVFYFPLDLPGPVRRTLDRIRPLMVIVAETEIWPNFLRQCGKRDIPVFMVNGRLSDRSYGRYRLARPWLGRVLDGYRLLGMRSQQDADRILALGAPPERVKVFGNLKYDGIASTGRLDASLRAALVRFQPLVVAGSTAAGEERLVIEAFKQLGRQRPTLRLLIAPRRPERFDEVEGIIRSAGLSCCRRSSLPADSENADVMLLDSIGELGAVYEHATVVFVGGTLVAHGGHNVLEPARFRKPVLFGPHMENFHDIAREFLDREAGFQVSNVDELVERIGFLLDRPESGLEVGRQARQILDDNAGATRGVLAAIRASVEPAPVE